MRDGVVVSVRAGLRGQADPGTLCAPPAPRAPRRSFSAALLRTEQGGCPCRRTASTHCTLGWERFSQVNTREPTLFLNLNACLSAAGQLISEVSLVAQSFSLVETGESPFCKKSRR